MTVIVGLDHLIKSSCFFIINIIGTAVGEKMYHNEPISVLFCGHGCRSLSSWWLTYVSVVIWKVQHACQSLPDWVSIAVFVLPYLPLGVFPFRVVPVRVYTLGPEPLTLLESSLKLYFMMLLSTLAWISLMSSNLYSFNWIFIFGNWKMSQGLETKFLYSWSRSCQYCFTQSQCWFLSLGTWGNKLCRKFAAWLNHQLKYISLYCFMGLECYKHCSLYTMYPHGWLDALFPHFHSSDMVR
jgi:hypothetical protein